MRETPTNNSSPPERWGKKLELETQYITEETRARNKPHNPLPSHQMPDKDEYLRVVSTSTNLTNVQMRVRQSSPQNNHMCVGSLTQMASASTAQSIQPPTSGSLTRPGAASSQSNKCSSTPDKATPQDDAPTISADIPSMTNNGELSIGNSHPPTLQNVDNEGRNASEPEHTGFCDSAQPSVSPFDFRFPLSDNDLEILDRVPPRDELLDRIAPLDLPDFGFLLRN